MVAVFIFNFFIFHTQLAVDYFVSLEHAVDAIEKLPKFAL
jgi:hypothetical protein